eukprot:8396-Heterococcus_DN1.PRE.1
MRHAKECTGAEQCSTCSTLSRALWRWSCHRFPDACRVSTKCVLLNAATYYAPACSTFERLLLNSHTVIAAVHGVSTRTTLAHCCTQAQHTLQSLLTAI